MKAKQTDVIPNRFQINETVYVVYLSNIWRTKVTGILLNNLAGLVYTVYLPYEDGQGFFDHELPASQVFESPTELALSPATIKCINDYKTQETSNESKQLD